MNDLGLEPGATVLVHCGMRAVGGDAAGLLADLRAVAGTVVVPTQTSGNSLTSRVYRAATQGMTESDRDAYEAGMPGFDPAVTPSQGMGVFAETVRRHPDARRSTHPQTSFAALGEHAAEVTAVHDLDCHLGERSPLAALYRLGATILMIGTEMRTCTALHLAEYRLRTPPPIMNYSCFVSENGRRRKLRFAAAALDDSDFGVLGNDLLEQPWVRTARIGSAVVRALPMVTAVDQAVTWFEKNRGRQ